MDAELLKLVIEVVTLIGTGLGLAMRVGSLKTSIEASLKSVEAKMKELQDDAKSERTETRASLGALKDGQTALALTQNGDHILLGRLDASFGALKEHVDKSLLAQREELSRLVQAQSEQRREVDRLLGRADRG
jgi:uncharacterized protein YqgV (UPF0045/DUF77 family)